MRSTTNPKAYKVYDKNCYEPYMMVIFAESAGQARGFAIRSDEFCEFRFTDIIAHRCKELDPFYRGEWCMDWMYMPDRIAMVRYANFECSYEVFHPRCNECDAREWCGRWQEDG